MTGSCSCGTITVVSSRTRLVQAASAPSSVRLSGFSNAMRSPQHSDEKGALVDGARPVLQNRRVQVRFHHRQSHCYLHTGDSGSMGRVGLTSTSIAHVRLTVTDIERSRRFYESVFGWPVLLEVPENADEATRNQLSFLFGGVIYDLGGTLLGLRPVATDRFHENRCGLDHIAFRLSSKAELDAAAAHLDEVGVQHEPVKDIGPSYILEFRDPDNIALELTAPK
jgi:glyoxylase I family protein